MRNQGVFLIFLVLILFMAGCAGDRGTLTGTVQLDETLPEYQPRQTKLTPEQRYIDQLLTKKGLNGNGNKPTVIVVHKLSRKLTLYKGTTPLKIYQIVLGPNPYGDKLYQGDNCTPEGVYKIKAKYPHHRWSKFIWLDYPNTQNWLKFSRAKQAGRVSQEADIGGQIGIHGTEDDLKNLRGENWTQGCVSLRNQDVEEIYHQVTDQTLVVIKKN